MIDLVSLWVGPSPQRELSQRQAYIAQMTPHTLLSSCRFCDVSSVGNSEV